jgi:hypothetical protein
VGWALGCEVGRFDGATDGWPEGKEVGHMQTVAPYEVAEGHATHTDDPATE